MSLNNFKPSTTMIPRDLLEIKIRAGGQAGTLSVGQEKIIALKLGPNVYATTESIPKNLKSIAGIEGADIHQIKSRADLVQFIQRWRVFNRE